MSSSTSILRRRLRECVEPNRRILVVDDARAIHDDFRKTLGAPALERAELDALHQELFGGDEAQPTDLFEVSSAYQGEEGLEAVRAARAAGRPFALAFVDVRMPPGMDGIDAAARMLAADPDIGIVICSAYSDHSWEDMRKALGTTDRVLILKKPFDTVEVRQLAHTLQRRWELARMVRLRIGDLKSLVDARTRELAAAKEKLEHEAHAREEALRQLAHSHEQIRALAYQDGLTGLPNRRLLNEHLEKVLARSRRKGIEFAVLFVDLDNFKLINDSIGHQAADDLLRRFAETLKGLVRSEDVINLCMERDIDIDTTITLEPITDSVLSRLGGDEFVILLPEIKDRFAAGAVAHRVLKRLEQPFATPRGEAFITASIGIATFPDDGQTAEVLMRNADTAMYHAKEQGKGAYQYYSAAMNAASVERLTLETGLRRALEEERLEVHYQPQIDVASGRIIGAEALARWNDPVRGQIPPAAFIPIAEDCGLIFAIGERVLRLACRQAVAWQRAGLPAIPVAVNVSGVQFRRQDLCQVVRSALEDSGLDPALLRLELTETSLMSVRDRAAQVLEQLKEMGVGVALDDFGTGYSSLSYLRLFPLDMLKIDSSFIAEMLADKTTASITEAIISMTRILGLRVLAEGVEHAAQYALLKELGCDAAQGFHFSAALPAEQFARLLASSGAPLRAVAGGAAAAERSSG